MSITGCICAARTPFGVGRRLSEQPREQRLGGRGRDANCFHERLLAGTWTFNVSTVAADALTAGGINCGRTSSPASSIPSDTRLTPQPRPDCAWVRRDCALGLACGAPVCAPAGSGPGLSYPGAVACSAGEVEDRR